MRKRFVFSAGRAIIYHVNPAAMTIFLASQVHLLSDLLGQADGVLAFREVLESSPALRALMAEARSRGDPMDVQESQYQRIEEKLGEKQPKRTQ